MMLLLRRRRATGSEHLLLGTLALDFLDRLGEELQTIVLMLRLFATLGRERQI